MGRYYSGDIDGKFWFGVQSSNAADRFGVIGDEPAYLTYYFDEEHLEDVEAEISEIEESLGDKIQKLDDFFASVNGYTDKDIHALGITSEELSDYADLGLGIKIRDCIKEFGSCSFDAEI
jgi:hypothetical protein